VTVPESFTFRRVGTMGCEILADGEVFAWTVDAAWAAVIVKLLDGAEEEDPTQDTRNPSARE
jgi:hypothetical protein